MFAFLTISPLRESSLSPRWTSRVAYCTGRSFFAVRKRLEEREKGNRRDMEKWGNKGQ